MKTILVLAVLASVLIARVEAVIIATEVQVTMNEASASATFRIAFDRSPDFFTTDSFGRPADSFQFYVDALSPVATGFNAHHQAAHGLIPDAGKTIIRGDEIRVDGDIKIRDIDPFYDGENDPYYGGWGPAAGAVPFILSGPQLSFEVPLGLLQSSGEVFYWGLQTYEFGGQGNTLIGSSDGAIVTYKAAPDSGSTLLLLCCGLAGTLLVGRMNISRRADRLPQRL